MPRPTYEELAHEICSLAQFIRDIATGVLGISGTERFRMLARSDMAANLARRASQPDDSAPK